MARLTVVVYDYYCDANGCDANDQATYGDAAPTKRGFIHGAVDANAELRRRGWAVIRSDHVLCPDHAGPSRSRRAQRRAQRNP